MKLSIIIVNYKTPDLLLECIRSIYSQPLEFAFEIIVVDNNSCDNSKSNLLKEFPLIKWIQNNENIGFARANNIGITNSNGEYILFLNSDTLIIDNAINKCIYEFEKNINVGLLGCRLLNIDGTTQKSVYYENADSVECFRNNLIFDYYVKKIIKHKKRTKENKKIKALMGSFLLVKYEVLKKIGFFDPDFFMYSEEFDLCRRFIKQGYSIKYFEDAAIIHYGGGSADIESMIKQRFLSAALLFLKTHGKIGLILYLISNFINFFTYILLVVFLRKETRIGNFKFYLIFFSLLKRYLSVIVKYNSHLGKGNQMLKYVEAG